MKQNIFAITAAMIWGMAFVVQSIGSLTLDALSFTALRFSLAAIFLLIICLYRRKGQSKALSPELLKASLGCGLVLAVSMVAQQIGLAHTSSGKAAFITALYILIVPIFEFVIYKRFKIKLLFALLLAAVGLYFLCVNGSFTIRLFDISLFVCAFLCALQIMIIDYYIDKVDDIEMACGQMLTAALICLIAMFLFKKVELYHIIEALPSLLYSGIVSGGIAYILQVKAQKGSNPSMISLLFSLESVFASLFGAIFLKQLMTSREILGCIIIMAAIVISIIDFKEKKK